MTVVIWRLITRTALEGTTCETIQLALKVGGGGGTG